MLHVPYRRTLVPGLAGLHEAACAAGAYGATLSGSGPTLVAIAPQDIAERVGRCHEETVERRGRGGRVVRAKATGNGRIKGNYFGATLVEPVVLFQSGSKWLPCGIPYTRTPLAPVIVCAPTIAFAIASSVA